MLEPRFQVYAGLDSLSRAAAEQFAALAAQAVAARERFSVALSGGGTPQALYRLLAQRPYRDLVPWPQTHCFWGDERCVPPDHPQSNYSMAQQALLGPAAVPPENLHRIKGELEPSAAAADYAAQLRQFADDPAAGSVRALAWPRFDLVLLGMGSDGHIASLSPGPITAAELNSPTITVTMDYEGRPAHRVTLTPLVFNTARNIIFLVTGESKAEALAAALTGPFDPERWPAQRIRPDQGSVTWLVDEAAASRLSNSIRKGGFDDRP